MNKQRIHHVVDVKTYLGRGSGRSSQRDFGLVPTDASRDSRVIPAIAIYRAVCRANDSRLVFGGVVPRRVRSTQRQSLIDAGKNAGPASGRIICIAWHIAVVVKGAVILIAAATGAERIIEPPVDCNIAREGTPVIE